MNNALNLHSNQTISTKFKNKHRCRKYDNNHFDYNKNNQTNNTLRRGKGLNKRRKHKKRNKLKQYTQQTASGKQYSYNKPKQKKLPNNINNQKYKHTKTGPMLDMNLKSIQYITCLHKGYGAYPFLKTNTQK
eukprot:99406_1